MQDGNAAILYRYWKVAYYIRTTTYHMDGKNLSRGYRSLKYFISREYHAERFNGSIQLIIIHRDLLGDVYA